MRRRDVLGRRLEALRVADGERAGTEERSD